MTFKAAILALALCVASGARVEHQRPDHAMTFDEFLAKYAKSYTPAEYKARRAIFHRSLEAIHQHNDDAGKSFHLGINKFADLTEAEVAAFRGFHSPAWRSMAEGKERATLPASGDSLPESWDWRDYDKVSPVKNQGSCGSCWAFSGVGALESALLMGNQTATSLSEQQFVDCVPNPSECGGAGGCEGATQPLLFDYAATHGAKLEADYTYTAKTGTTCEEDEYPTVATIQGYGILPENCDVAMLQAFMLEFGPIAVSVDASAWSHYSGGVLDFESCGSDIDHAVLLVGYGTDSELGADYWTIKNSWGSDWGEQGFIRLSRADGTKVDATPGDGAGCDGGPASVNVRGTCGVLYANSYAFGAQLVPLNSSQTTPNSKSLAGSDPNTWAPKAKPPTASTTRTATANASTGTGADEVAEVNKAALFKAAKAPRGINGAGLRGIN